MGDSQYLLIDHRVFSEPIDVPKSSGWGRNRHALVRAASLLSEAGWSVERGMLRNSLGVPFEFEFLSTNVSERRVLLPYIDTLRLLGINARINLVESAQNINLRRSRDFDMIIESHAMIMPPIIQLPVFFSSGASEQALTRNVAGINDPVIDALITNATQTLSFSDMTTACRALDRVLFRGYYHIPLQMIANTRIMFWDLFGYPGTKETATHLAGSESWRYDPQKAARIESLR